MADHTFDLQVRVERQAMRREGDSAHRELLDNFGGFAEWDVAYNRVGFARELEIQKISRNDLDIPTIFRHSLSAKQMSSSMAISLRTRLTSALVSAPRPGPTSITRRPEK